MSGALRLRKRIAPLVRWVRSQDERRDVWSELVRRTRGEPALPSPSIRHVLVICLGNICRSPFAERLLARERPALVVRSAGVEARDGDPAEPHAIEVAREFDIDLRDHAARRLSERDLVWADLVIGMTGRHQGMVRDRWPAHAGKVRLLGDFLEGPPHALEDPWGESPEVFRAVYRRIEAASVRLGRQLPGAAEGDSAASVSTAEAAR